MRASKPQEWNNINSNFAFLSHCFAQQYCTTQPGRLVLLTKPNGTNAAAAHPTSANAAAPIHPTPTAASLDQLRRQYTKYIANNFITKTCLTTFTYLTNIHVQDGKTSYESHEQVIRNVATERYVAPEGLAAAADKLLQDFHSTIIEPSEIFNPQLHTEIQSTIFAVEKTPELSVSTQYTTYSYRNEIVAKENANEVGAESNDVEVQLNAAESVKVIKNLVTVPYFEGSSSGDYPEPTRTLEATTILNTYMRPLEKSLTLRQIVKTVINNEPPEAELDDEIDSTPAESEPVLTSTSSTPAIIENFKKLAPVVLNAMADLLQKFPGNVKQKAAEKSDEILAEDNAHFKKPIYIPVIADSGDLQASASTHGAGAIIAEKHSNGFGHLEPATSESEVKLQILDHNHFLPPNIGHSSQLHLNDHEIEGLPSHKHELHLMDLKLQGNSPLHFSHKDQATNNGVGIPISPGEIINTNSDVIIGRPAIGSGPRLPNSVNSIPLQAHVHHHQQQPQHHGSQQFHNNLHQHLSAQPSIVQEEIYHGPPPPPPAQPSERKPIPLKLNPSSAVQEPLHLPELTFNIPPNRPPIQPPVPPPHFHSGHNPHGIKGPGPLIQRPFQHNDGPPPPIHFYQKPVDHLLKPQHLNRPQHQSHHHQLQQHHHQKQNQYHQHHHNQQQQQHQQQQQYHHSQQRPNEHQGTPQLLHPGAAITVADNGYFGNDILEIKPIPEVFSTDLPPELVQLNGGEGNSHLHVQVDLQPSQVTNIIIPSRNDFGSTSVNAPFVKSKNIGGGVGSVSTTGTGSVSSDPNQKFTYGKYFSEPSPYQGPEKFLEFYTNKPQLVVLDKQSGETKAVRQKDGPNPTFIQFQPNAANEISVHASPIQFQQSTAVDDLEINGGHRDEPISVSTSNRVSSVSSLDGKTQIKVSEQPDDKETDTRDILIQNHFNFNSNVRGESAPPTSTTRPVNPHGSSGNFRQHLGPFAFNQGQPIQTPSFATNQVLIDNQSPFIDIQLSSHIGTDQGTSKFGQVLAPNGVNNEASQGNNSPPVLRNPSIQRPFKGEGFKHQPQQQQQQQQQHHHLSHPPQQSRPIVPPPAPVLHQQLPFEVQSQQFNKRPQSAPIQSSSSDNHDRMTSQGPNMQISQQSQDNLKHQNNSPPRSVHSTDHYNHQSYGQNPPPPPAPPTPPPQPAPPQFNPTFWNGPPPGKAPNTPPPYPFEKAPMPPTPPPMKRLPGSPIQGPSTLQSHVKQQQNVQYAVNDSINEIAGSHLSIMTPPPAVATTNAPSPPVTRPRPDVRSPILGDHSNVNLRVQASPQSINNEFQQLINDGQYFASSTAAPQQVDVHSFTPSGSGGITTPDMVTVDSQTEYNGLTQMSKYHHIERKPAAHPPSHHHHTSMKISRVPQQPRPQPAFPPQQQQQQHHVRNSTYATQYEVGNNGDGQMLPPSNLKTNSRGTSKFYFNLNHKPYQFQNRQRPTTTMFPIDITTTTVATQIVQQPSTISTIRLRLPHKGMPFNKSPSSSVASPSSVASTIADDQMDLTPPPVRPIQLSYGHGFQKPSRFDGNDSTKPPQTGNSVYQTIKRPLRPSPVEIQESSTSAPVEVTEKLQSYWDSHRDAPVRNRGPPPTTSPSSQDDEVTASSVPTPPRRTSIRDRPQVVFTTEGPYQFETAEPDIITVADGKDDSVYLKASWGPPYSFDQGPKIILTKKPEGDAPQEDILKSNGSEYEMENTGRPSIDLVVIQAPRTNPTTTTVEPTKMTKNTRQEASPETTSMTSDIPITPTQAPTTTTELYDLETTTTEEVETEAPTTRSYIQAVRLRPKLSLSTTTHKPIMIRTNATFVKPADRPRIPFLRPSISVVSINSSTTTTTEGPLNKTESILVVMRPANQQPIVPHQHRPIGIITRKPDTKRPTNFHGAVTRDEDDAFHTNADSRLVIAGVHHIQDNGFPNDNKNFGGKVSSNGESGNIFIHPDAETGHSADEDPSASASGSGSGSVEHSPDDYVVCEPGCNAAKNEKCVLFSDPGLGTLDGAIVKYTKCACRPGFARMFPDRPCKPTYTYTVNLRLNRYGAKQLIYDDTLSDPSSKKFEFLRQLTKDSLDRMLMQSDVRDIYHGIKAIQFHPIRKANRNVDKSSTFENMEIYENGLKSEFILQLSENTEAERLSDILLKQVRKNGYKVGNTDLTTFPVSVGIINPSPLVNVTDFDECQSDQDNDCSKNALCYNLKGTYTCNCRENYADASDLPSVYPGRKCTNDKIGCATCHFNGRCVPEGGCECYRWYFGPACQFNLKVILYATLLGFLLLLVFLFLLFFCILLKRKNNDPRHKFQHQVIHGILTKPGVSTATQATAYQRRTVPEDERDEVSSDTTNSTTASQQQLRAVRAAPKGPTSQYEKRRNPVFYYQQPTSTTQKSNRSIKSTQGSVVLRKPTSQDQMQVMIPRAKFYSQSDVSLKKEKESVVLAQQAKEKRKIAQDKQSVTTSVYSSHMEAKLLSYLDASAAAPERKKSDPKKMTPYQSTGALVSAGFEVSATVGLTRPPMKGERFTETMNSKKMDIGDLEEEDLMLLNDSISVKAANRRYDETDGNQDTASDWFRDDEHDRDCHMNHHHNSTTYRTVSEARSYGETTIQPATKTLRANSHINSHAGGGGDEANTMAERDIGSTFLLPHTHLYKPTTDRGSDMSGFDSI